MKVGQKVLLKLRGLPEQSYTIAYIGPYSVKVEDDSGSTYTVKKKSVRFQLYGPPKDSDRSSSSVDAISVPIGGKSDSKR